MMQEIVMFGEKINVMSNSVEEYGLHLRKKLKYYSQYAIHEL